MDEVSSADPSELSLSDVSVLGLQRSAKILVRRQPRKASSDSVSNPRPAGAD